MLTGCKKDNAEQKSKNTFVLNFRSLEDGTNHGVGCHAGCSKQSQEE